MKIGLIYQKFVSTGGLEGYLFRFAKALLDAGHQLVVFTGETDDASEALPLDIQKVDLPSSKTRALLAFERAAEQHGPDLPVDITFGFGRTTRQHIHRAGSGCHAAYIPLLNPVKRLGFKSRLELALENDLYTSGRTDRFVVNSELVRDQLVEHYQVPTDRFSIIHTAVESDRFRPSPEARAAFRTAQSLPDDRPALLFVSRSHRRKGLPALLEAWPEINAKTGAQLWIAGPKIDRFFNAVPAEIHDTVTHFEDVDDIVPLYQSADLFVHPTLYDACANTVLQSMACGLPGVISAADGARQFIDEGTTGWLLDDPSSPAEIASRVGVALAADRAAVGESAREKTLPLTWEAHVAAWERLTAAL